jgi:hypothetical protein
MFEWLTLWPVWGPLAVSSQRRDISKILFHPRHRQAHLAAARGSKIASISRNCGRIGGDGHPVKVFGRVATRSKASSPLFWRVFFTRGGKSTALETAMGPKHGIGRFPRGSSHLRGSYKGRNPRRHHGFSRKRPAFRKRLKAMRGLIEARFSRKRARCLPDISDYMNISSRRSREIHS